MGEVSGRFRPCSRPLFPRCRISENYCRIRIGPSRFRAVASEFLRRSRYRGALGKTRRILRMAFHAASETPESRGSELGTAELRRLCASEESAEMSEGGLIGPVEIFRCALFRCYVQERSGRIPGARRSEREPGIGMRFGRFGSGKETVRGVRIRSAFAPRSFRRGRSSRYRFARRDRVRIDRPRRFGDPKGGVFGRFFPFRRVRYGSRRGSFPLRILGKGGVRLRRTGADESPYRKDSRRRRRGIRTFR